MGAEATLQAKCRKWASSHRWWCAKFTSPGTVGVPDYLFIRDGLVVFIEFKAPGKTPSKLQIHTMQQMVTHGARVAVIDDFESFQRLMQ